MCAILCAHGLCCFFFSSRRRHTRCALVTGVQTCALPISCIAEIAFHVERELARIDRFEARIEYAELFASFAGEFLDLRDPAAPPDCLHPDIGVGYPAGNALAAEVRRRGVNGIVYPSEIGRAHV